MALPRDVRLLRDDLTAISSNLSNVQTALENLPAVPLEADLPDIVAIVASLKTVTDDLTTSVDSLVNTLSKVRINQ